MLPLPAGVSRVNYLVHGLKRLPDFSLGLLSLVRVLHGVQGGEWAVAIDRDGAMGALPVTVIRSSSSLISLIDESMRSLRPVSLPLPPDAGASFGCFGPHSG